MIHDIKVFDKHGNLKEIINGQKCFDRIYEQGAKSFITERKKTKVTFICRFCKESFPRSSPSQFCCNKEKCRYQRVLERKPLKGGRDIVCRVCNKKTTVPHSRAVTCGKECSKELNRKNNIANARKRKGRQDVRTKPGDSEIAGRKRKAVHETGNTGETDETFRDKAERLYGKFKIILQKGK